MGVANQCATKIGSLFVFSKGMFFFFRLDTKEKEPKRKNQGCVFSATPVLPSAKGQKLATLKQSALFDAEENTCVFSATPVLPSAKGQKLATLKQSALFDAEENTCA